MQNGGTVKVEQAELHIERTGRPADAEVTPVLLIQGVGVAGRAWRPQLRALGAEFPVATFDNRGIGRSPGRPGDMIEMGQDVLEVLDRLDWPAAHLVGHSLGGVIAQQAALLAPERVRSLSLLCSFADGGVVFRPSLRSLWLNLRTVFGTAAMRRRAFFEMVSDPTIEPDEEAIMRLEEIFERSLHELPQATMAQVWALFRTDMRPSLGGLEVPTLALSARSDNVAPPSQGRVLADLLRGRFVEVDGGHACTIQQATEVNRVLVEFLRDPESLCCR